VTERAYFGDDSPRCSAGGNTGEAGTGCGSPICGLALLVLLLDEDGQHAGMVPHQPSRGLRQGHRRPWHRTKGGIVRHGHVPQRTVIVTDILQNPLWRRTGTWPSPMGSAPAGPPHSWAFGQDAGLVCHVLPRTAQSEPAETAPWSWPPTSLALPLNASWRVKSANDCVGPRQISRT